MSNHCPGLYKRMEKYENDYPALCPICMKVLGTIKESGKLTPKIDGVISAGKFYFCSEKCMKQFDREMTE